MLVLKNSSSRSFVLILYINARFTLFQCCFYFFLASSKIFAYLREKKTVCFLFHSDSNIIFILFFCVYFVFFFYFFFLLLPALVLRFTSAIWVYRCLCHASVVVANALPSFCMLNFNWNNYTDMREYRSHARTTTFQCEIKAKRNTRAMFSCFVVDSVSPFQYTQ